MIENNDFIQLPPIKKDTPSEVVSMIWQYLKLPEESRKRVKADLIDVHENCGKEDFQIPDLYDIVPKEEIAEFEDIMRKIITGIISEASGIATWVYVQKYEKPIWDQVLLNGMYTALYVEHLLKRAHKAIQKWSAKNVAVHWRYL